MSGPIIRSGPSSEYTKNWEKAFGKKKSKKTAAKAKEEKAGASKSNKKDK